MTKLLISLGANTNTTANWSLKEQKLFLGHLQLINSHIGGYLGGTKVGMAALTNLEGLNNVSGTAVHFATVLKGINNDRFSNDEMNYLVEFVTEEVRTIEPK